MGRNLRLNQIERIHQVFLRTGSVVMTAKLCDCNRGTVAKYKQKYHWIDEIEESRLDKGGVQPSLTPEIALKFATMWHFHINDKDICGIVGVKEKQLTNWLQRNTKVVIPIIIKRVDETGNNIEHRTTEKIGFRELRTRERAKLEVDYMTHHENAIKLAIASGDFKAATKALEWVLSKRFPKRYPQNTGISVDVNTTNIQSTTIVNIDDLDLPLETRKQILSKIRKQKQLTEIGKENEDE
jgi:hypothetical protein